MYSECVNRLPRLPASHNNINDSRLGEFLRKSYNNYTAEFDTRYNFSLALKWYLDSISLRDDVMRFISASTSFESILDGFSTESGQILPKKEFKELKDVLSATIQNNIGAGTPLEDVETMVNRLADINRRPYRKKAEALLVFLGLRDETTRDFEGYHRSKRFDYPYRTVHDHKFGLTKGREVLSCYINTPNQNLSKNFAC